MSDAITHYGQLRELTIDELAYVLLMLDHPISADALAEMERCARPVTVDDLVAIAYVLDTTPAVLLSHIPIDMPEPEGPFATGLPSDVDPNRASCLDRGGDQARPRVAGARVGRAGRPPQGQVGTPRGTAAGSVRRAA
ncbi:hypothetical protein [Streptomyces virginiae]|uniref:hypothetical protein n=1 Tax=Streptomyces virginiae TaxID=1961 RepID=UPI003870C39E|nr:hypothetical protein OG253_32725 [Streptomyces virginiae]